MPLYGHGLVGAPYSFPKTLTVKEVQKFHKILRESMKSFTYHEDKVFLSEIHILNQAHVLAKYNFGRPTTITQGHMFKLEALIKEMNDMVNKEFGSKADNYKVDIAGNWDTGVIVVLVKNPNFYQDKKVNVTPPKKK